MSTICVLAIVRHGRSLGRYSGSLQGMGCLGKNPIGVSRPTDAGTYIPLISVLSFGMHCCPIISGIQGPIKILAYLYHPLGGASRRTDGAKEAQHRA
jgi:hypothetical protein